MDASKPRLETAEQFLHDNTMMSLLGIPEEAMDAVLATAYQLYLAGRYGEVEVLCRGLRAADHRYWWPYSLLAATLRRRGRLREALAEVDTALLYEPGQQQLLMMRGEILAALGGWQDGPTPNTNLTVAA